MATAIREVNYLDYVRRRLGETDSAALTRIAADAGVSVRTLYNIQNTERGAQYDTVMSLYRVLKAAEPKKRARQ